MTPLLPATIALILRHPLSRRVIRTLLDEGRIDRDTAERLVSLQPARCPVAESNVTKHDLLLLTSEITTDVAMQYAEHCDAGSVAAGKPKVGESFVDYSAYLPILVRTLLDGAITYAGPGAKALLESERDLIKQFVSDKALAYLIDLAEMLEDHAAS